MKIYQPHKQKILQALNQQSQTNTLQSSLQHFSTVAAPRQESNVLKGQHIRYIPKKRLNFDFNSPEGPLHLFYQSNDNLYKRINNWKTSAAVASPAAVLAYYTLGSQFWWAYPMLFLPTMIHLQDYVKLKFFVFRTEAYRIWLLKNGDQIIVETYDGMLHRMNIADNESHDVIENKDHLVFVMNNSGRDYLITNKNCVKIDYDLIDRVIKGIYIDAGKFQSLYNRLIFRQTPSNLRPNKFNRYLPQSFNINENKTIWKILNRTLYRDDEDNQWLRNHNRKTEIQKKNITGAEREIIRKLIEDHGFKYLYSEQNFYKTHRISRADFLKKIESVKSQDEKDQLIMSLFDDAAIQGRRGVLDTQSSIRVIKKKIQDKEKFKKFAKKFGGADIEDLRAPGTSFASLKDLM